MGTVLWFEEIPSFYDLDAVWASSLEEEEVKSFMEEACSSWEDENDLDQ